MLLVLIDNMYWNKDVDQANNSSHENIWQKLGPLTFMGSVEYDVLCVTILEFGPWWGAYVSQPVLNHSL